MLGGKNTREGVGRKGCGGGRKLPRRHYGTSWRRQHGLPDQYIWRGAEKQLTWSKRAGGRRTAGTGRRPGVRMNPQWRRVVWGGTRTGSEDQGIV